MKLRRGLLWIGMCRLMTTDLPGAAATDAIIRHGFRCLNFSLAGRSFLLVVPETPAAGKRWIWRTEFFHHQPQADLALLSNGWHVAYVNVQKLMVRRWLLITWTVFMTTLARDAGHYLATRRSLTDFEG